MSKPYVLIDFENVQPKTLDRLQPGSVRIKVFLGQHQNRLMLELVQALQPFGADAEYIAIQGSGPDAVDFHIAFYIGRLAAEDPGATFTIISRDKGFDPLVRHLVGLGIPCQRHSRHRRHARGGETGGEEGDKGRAEDGAEGGREEGASETRPGETGGGETGRTETGRDAAPAAKRGAFRGEGHPDPRGGSGGAAEEILEAGEDDHAAVIDQILVQAGAGRESGGRHRAGAARQRPDQGRMAPRSPTRSIARAGRLSSRQVFRFANSITIPRRWSPRSD